MHPHHRILDPLVNHPIIGALGSVLSCVGAFLVASIPVLQALALLLSVIVSIATLVAMREKQRERKQEQSRRIFEP